MTNKIIIAVVIIAVIGGLWWYFAGNNAAAPANQNGTDTGSLPAASASLDDIDAAVTADVAQSTSLTSGDDAAAAALIGAQSVSNAAAAGSY